MLRRRVFSMVGLVVALTFGVGAAAIGATIFERPAEGPQYLYFGSAMDSTDPDQAEVDDNDVALFDTTGGDPVGLFRSLGDRGELVYALDNQLAFKYYLESPRTCGGGSPRIQLAVDEDGDGTADGNLHGHVRPPYNACQQDTWVYEDLTDDLMRWEIGAGLTGSRPFPFYTWTEVEGLLGGATALSGQLIEDAQAFAVTNQGIAYYDVISIGNRSMEDHNDTADGT